MFHRLFQSLLTLFVTCLVMLLWDASPVRSQTLTPQKVQEMTDYGVKVADAERRMQEIDKELSKPNLDQATKDKLERDKADADRSRQANQNSVENLEGKGSDAHKMFEKARDARRKQHELEDAKRAAENAQGEDKKKADRRVNRVRLEFEDAKKGIGTLPNLPQPYSVMASAWGATISGTQAYALLDECNRLLLVASDTRRHAPLAGLPANESSISSPVRLVRFFGTVGRTFDHAQPPLRLVADPLPPEVVEQMNKLGKDIADYEHQKETLEKELRDNKDGKTGEKLNGDQFKQKQQELDNVKEKLKSAEDNKQFISPEARKVAEDAYKARKAQYALPEQIRQLRAKGDSASLQQAQLLEQQLQGLNQFYGPIAFAPAIVAPGQSGYAMLGTPVGSVGSQSLKGHSRLVATGEIKKQTTTELELDQLAHLEEEPSETSSFAQYFGYDFGTSSWGKGNWSIGAQWSARDEKPPNVAAIGNDGGFQFSDVKFLPKTCYRLNIAYGYDHVSSAISSQGAAHTYETTVNANPTWIAGFKPGFKLGQIQTGYMEAGQIAGTRYGWIDWSTPFADAPLISSGQVSDEGYQHTSWQDPFKNFMAFGELSPGTSPLPVAGLGPANWPHTAAEPIPFLLLNGTWLEDQ